MWSQNMGANVFAWAVILYFISLIVFASPMIVQSIKDGLSGEPFKTLRDLRADHEEAEYLSIISQTPVREIKKVRAIPVRSQPICPLCGRPHKSAKYLNADHLLFG